RRMPHAVSELDHVWVQIQQGLRRLVGERTYGLWLAPLRCASLDGELLALDGPREVSGWASARLGTAVASVSAGVLGRAVGVTINGRPLAGSVTASGAKPAPSSPQRLNPKYTFEQF